MRKILSWILKRLFKNYIFINPDNNTVVELNFNDIQRFLWALRQIELEEKIEIEKLKEQLPSFSTFEYRREEWLLKKLIDSNKKNNELLNKLGSIRDLNKFFPTHEKH